LTWSFPGGKLAYKEDMEFYLKEEILKKTWMEVTPNDVVFAKTYPEDRSFLSVYYLCTPTGGTLKAGWSFQDVRRVKPIEVEKYFTTSLSPKLLEYLKTLK
jgi:ADP-ribose pyrophosphatase YjhB (NUDIX family)